MVTKSQSQVVKVRAPAAKKARRRSNPDDQMPDFSELAVVEDQALLTFVEDQLRIYGQETNLERSIPDYRDGMKPVARRVMWGLSLLPREQNVKSARVVGDVMGKYHPHGDLSIYSTITTLVNFPVPPIDGEGGWGTLIDGPAAMRYTNAKLSNYGKTFFGRFYSPITQYVPSFDGKDKEPLVLPALLPNLLFNGTMGIGVGVRTSIPAYTPQSVLGMMIRLLDKEELTPDDYARGLEFYHQYGGRVAKTKQNLQLLRQFYADTKGSAVWSSPVEVDREKKQIILTEYAPGINPIKLVEDVIKPMHEVSAVYNQSGLNYVIQARRDVNYTEFDKLVEKIKKVTSSRVSYEIYVTERNPDAENPEKYKVGFFTASIPDLMVKWLKWRVKLEARSLDYQIDLSKKQIAYLELLIFACSKLEVIFECLKLREGHAEWLSKKLKISLQDANTILDLKVRQLSKLDLEDLKNNKLKDAKAKLDVLLVKRKKPSLEVRKFLVGAQTHFDKYTRFSGTFQFGMQFT